MICSKDPRFPLAVLVELCPFLQRQHFSCFIVVLLFCFLYIYNVATFILLSNDSDSNCFLFPLKMHTRNWSKQTNKTGIRSRVLHVVAFVVVVGFRPPLQSIKPI